MSHLRTNLINVTSVDSPAGLVVVVVVGAFVVVVVGAFVVVVVGAFVVVVVGAAVVVVVGAAVVVVVGAAVVVVVGAFVVDVVGAAVVVVVAAAFTPVVLSSRAGSFGVQLATRLLPKTTTSEMMFEKVFHWIVWPALSDLSVVAMWMPGACSASDWTGPVSTIVTPLAPTLLDADTFPPVKVTASTDATWAGMGKT